MGVLYGNAYLIYHAARGYFGKILFLYITLPLMAIWLFIGLFFNVSSQVSTPIPIPAYAHIALMPFLGFKPLFHVAVGLGSTRLQFLKAFYGVGILATAGTILLLNLCQYVLLLLYNHWMGWSNIVHPALLFMEEFHFIRFFGVDVMFGQFLFGLFSLIFCVWYRLGSARSIMLLMVVIISGLFLYYGGVLESWFTWISLNIKPMTAFILLGIIGLVALFSTYPLMRNAPLQKE